MKKYFLFAAAMLLSASMFAVEGGDGSTKANAIDYDWTNGTSILPKKDQGKWYDVKLTDPRAQLDVLTNPEANIIVRNPMSEEVTLTVTAYVGDESQVKVLTIAAGQSKSITISAALLLRMGITNIYLYVETDKDIVEQVPVKDEQGLEPGQEGYIPTYEEKEVEINVSTAEAGAVQFTPDPFVWNADNNLAANKEQWYEINLNDPYLAEVAWDAQMVKLSVANNTTASADATFAFSATCPATGITEQSRTIGAGQLVTKNVDGSMLVAMSDNKKLYIRAKSSKALVLRAEVIDIPAGTPEVFDATTSTAIALNTTYTQANGSIFSMAATTLKGVAASENLVLTLKNNSGSVLTLHGAVAVNNKKPFSAQTRDLALSAGETYTKVIDRDLYKGLADGDVLYGQLTADGNYDFIFTTECKDEMPCADAETLTTFDHVNTTFVHNAGKKWYRVDITTAKAEAKNLELTITPTATVNIKADVALECACGAAMQTYKSTLKAEATKLISYSLFKDIQEQYIYIRVDADEEITIKVAPETEIPTIVDGNWDDPDKWNTTEVPGENDDVRVKGSATIPANEIAEVNGLEITSDGILTVAGKLIVGENGITGATSPSQLIVKEGAEIVFLGTKNVTPNATVEMDIQAVHTAEGNRYQAIGIPASNLPVIDNARYFEWIWSTGWNEVANATQAFKGYYIGSTATSAKGIVTATGKTFGNANKTLVLTGSKKHDNVFANSYLANINMAALCAAAPGEIFVNVEGQWKAKSTAIISANSDENTPIKVGEGFVARTEANSPVIVLDYQNMVGIPTQLAPARVSANQTQVRLTIEAENGKSDYIYLAMGEETYTGKMLSSKPFINVYANANNEECTLVKNENLVGTTITLGANASTNYTLRADLVSGDILYVKDLVNGNVIALTEGAEYNFTAEANKTSNRFQVIGKHNVATGIENTEIEGVNKFIENGQVMIIKNGVKYNTVGQIVK